MALRAGEKPMNRTTRRARFALPTALAALVATGFSAASLAAGCGSGQTNDAACTLGSEGCPCDTDGVAVGCSESVDYIVGSDTTQCRSGTRTCQGGKWGACVGTKRSFQSVPSAVLKSSTPTPCTSNPCDPGCQVFVDTGGDLDSGVVTANEAGGISLTPQDGGVGNWEGGAPTCTGLQCRIDPCPASSAGYLATKVVGSVYDPAGLNPIPNVVVYIPNGTVAEPTDGISCDSCAATTGNPIVTAVTDYKGQFTLSGVPSGANIPIVIKSGKWQRQLTLTSVTACGTTDSSTQYGADGLKLIRFPRNRTEGHIPRIGFVSGSADPFQCVLSKMGLDTSVATGEFSNAVTSAGALKPQRVHYYNSYDSSGNQLASNLGGPGEWADALWGSSTRLANYDAIILSCEGAEYPKGDTYTNNVVNYAALGGRVFATHYSYTWPYRALTGTSPHWNDTASWNPEQSHATTITGYIDQSFAKGATMAKWLQYVGASPVLGQLTINDPRRDLNYVNRTYATPWVYATSDNTSLPAGTGAYCSADSQCGANSCQGVGYCQDGSSCGKGVAGSCASLTQFCSSAADCAGGNEVCSTFTNNVCTVSTTAPPTNTGKSCGSTSDCSDGGLVCLGATGDAFCSDWNACSADSDCASNTTSVCNVNADCPTPHGKCMNGANEVCAVSNFTKTGSTPPANNGKPCAVKADCADLGLDCTGSSPAGYCASNQVCTSDANCTGAAATCHAAADCAGASLGVTCVSSTATKYCVAKNGSGAYTSTSCIGGACSDGKVCTKNKNCTATHAKTCTTNADCGGAYTCGYNDAVASAVCKTPTSAKCVTAAHSCAQITCAKDRDCATNEWCNGGKCVLGTKTTGHHVQACDNGFCPDGTTCSTDGDCASATRTCSTNADCKGASTECVAANTISDFTNPTAGSTYVGLCYYHTSSSDTLGQCDAMTCDQKSCTLASDCGSGESCTGGLCAVTGNMVGVCSGGKCPDNSACTADSDCGLRTRLCTADGECTATNGKCVQANTSVVGHTNLCAFKAPTGNVMSLTAGSSYIGVCDGPACGKACTTSSDCASGYECVGGKCLKNHNMEPLMTFNTPVGAAAASQCGRVVFSDFHVAASALVQTSGTFPGNCKAGALSAQEKALEYMLFDLTSCISPDYVPPGGGGPPFSVPMAVTRDYTASCPTGTAPVWHFFDWATTTPSDSWVEFFAQSGPTATTLMPSSATLRLASVSGATVPPWKGVDVATVFAAASPAVTPGAVLRITFVLHPSSDMLTSPTIDAWRQAYDCVAIE